jgi:uridylate kinase
MATANDAKPIVLSLGGSLIVPKAGIDVGFLAAFRDFIRRQVEGGRRFIIICGGGKTCRDYQAALRETGVEERDLVDWIGIHVTRLNAQLVRTILGDIAAPTVVTKAEQLAETMSPVVVAAGDEPGCSSDQDAVVLAEHAGAGTIINLSNIAMVYSDDPSVYPDARPITRMTWGEFNEKFGGEWRPGMHVPFDPVASATAARLGMRVVIASGGDLVNLERVIEDTGFVGTVIED